jgi:hypothetical protein
MNFNKSKNSLHCYCIKCVILEYVVWFLVPPGTVCLTVLVSAHLSNGIEPGSEVQTPRGHILFSTMIKWTWE